MAIAAAINTLPESTKYIEPSHTGLILYIGILIHLYTAAISP